MDRKTAARALFLCSSTERILLNLRSPHKTHGLKWSLWGGMAEANETPLECLSRELKEEMGGHPDIEKFYSVDIFQSPDKNFMYFSYVCIVREEFTPQLNNENCGYCWTKLGVWPRPMHFGAKKSLCSKASLAKLKFILSNHKD